MQRDVPKGIEYAQKAKLNLLKKEMEELELRRQEEEAAAEEEERKKKTAIDPEKARLNAEFLQIFLHGLKETIQRPYEVYDEALKDLYVEDNMPNVFLQKIMKGVAKMVLRVAEEDIAMKGMKGIDYRQHKASKIASKNAEVMKEAEYKKIMEVQKGVAMLKEMRER
jgi:hypothetical protein